MRTTALKTTILLGTLLALTGCTTSTGTSSPSTNTSPTPTPTASATPTAQADDCSLVLAAVENTRPVLAEALTYGSQEGNTDPVDSRIAPLVDNLNSLAEQVKDPQLSSATQQVADTVNAMRITMNDITVARLAAQSAQAIAVVEQTPETAQAAADAVNELAAQIRRSADEMTVHGTDFTTHVAALEQLCA
jgi:hypothetical protein